MYSFENIQLTNVEIRTEGNFRDSLGLLFVQIGFCFIHIDCCVDQDRSIIRLNGKERSTEEEEEEKIEQI